MRGRVRLSLLLSASVILSQLGPGALARAQAAGPSDQAEWQRLCLSRLAQYNKIRASHGLPKWSRSEAETECGAAWALAGPDTKQREPIMQGRAAGEECFLTTACCEALGLADDCFELRTLRRFRDRVMLASEEGTQEVRVYYALAPAIARALSRPENRGRARDLYYRFILPCTVLVRLGCTAQARALYRRMVVDLSRSLTPDLAEPSMG